MRREMHFFDSMSLIIKQIAQAAIDEVGMIKCKFSGNSSVSGLLNGLRDSLDELRWHTTVFPILSR